MTTVHKEASTAEWITDYATEILAAAQTLEEEIKAISQTLEENDTPESHDVSNALGSLETLQDEMGSLKDALTKLKTKPTVTILS